MLLSTNPVNSVLFLIVVFFSISFLFIFLNADFIGILILIIYIGAIAVLFLFIVMLTNIKKIERDTSTYLIVGILFLLILFFQLTYVLIDNFLDFSNFTIMNSNYLFLESDTVDEGSKFFLLYYMGFMLFYTSPYLVIYSGLLLLMSIVASIYLTNFKNGFSMRKQYNDQL
jgi:NADH-quinone oxidoreductase subunit J